MGLHLEVAGPPEGYPVVFLHGAVAEGGQSWQSQVRDLTEDLRCYVVDLPGHGGSSAVPWASMEDTADQVADAIKRETAGAVGVVGMSLGGCVAVRLVMRHPELVASAVVSGVSVLPASFGTRMWQRGQLLARYTSLGSLLPAGDRGPANNGDRTGARAAPAAVARQAQRKIADEIVNFRLPAGGQKVECALLAVAGEHESRQILLSLRPLAARFTAGMAKYAPESGAAWNTEHPELFNAMVRSWVSEQRLPPKLRDPEQWTG
ncbi:alpha/beta fold hydrolase [Phytoactinopolyspora limicola]|uniref:alpha/beta fold hydrolase n=1 Tax=Phytoactinopolyspora limicola TaxID=2715536 RepID=UPI00140E148D|nr:alpha/beta hydrolase [Phytoactinopolyspora limicola]